MGTFPPTANGVFATFAWDMHHEAPITDPEHLGRRALTSYRIGDLEWHLPKRKATSLGERLQHITTPDELEALAPVYATELAAALGAPDAFAHTVDVHVCSWQLGPLKFREWTVVATLEGAPTGGELDVRLPAARAAALGPGDVLSSLRVEPRQRPQAVHPAATNRARSSPGSGVGEKRPSARR
jgi:hypothetical protein